MTQSISSSQPVASTPQSQPRPEWLRNFQQPPAECRPALQWSWNGEITKSEIEVGLRDFQEKGVGGFFMHARPGLEIGYIMPEWFEAWEHAADQCRQMGMLWHIYDEFTCPGGHAGGHTIARAPQAAVSELRLRRADELEDLRPSEEALGWFSLEGEPVDPPEKGQAGGPMRIVAVMTPMAMRPEKGGFPMPDLTHPEAVRAFIASTHEKYAKHSGQHFGETVLYCFCDEPSLYHSTDALPLSPRILIAFEQEHGYRLQDRLADFCFAKTHSAEVRYDYWKTMRRLFDDNFFKPLFEWCARNKLGFTGHVMENQWPSPLSNPNSMATYRWMHAPGNDLLGFQYLRTHLRDNGLYYLNLKELSSSAAQLGRDETVMVESSGADGYAAAYALFKTCEDFLLSFGVNIMDPHLSHWTLAGARKYDWAQTLSPHSPWWDCYKTHADHVARVIGAQREGVERNRLLVLHPTLTGWLGAVPQQGRLWGASEEPEHLQLREVTTEFYMDLHAAQLDFDLGDEILMEDLAEVTPEGFQVGERSYQALVLPPTMLTLTESTLSLLQRWLENGGQIFAAGSPPVRVEGRLDSRPAELQKKFAGQWQQFDSSSELTAALRNTVPPRLTDPEGQALPEDLIWRRTELDGGGTLWFFCAPWEDGVQATVRIAGDSIQELDTATGELREVPEARPTDGALILPLDLPARGHRFFHVGQATADQRVTKALPELPLLAPDALRFQQAQREEPNLMLLDYCRLAEGVSEAGEAQFGTPRCTSHADSQHWRRYGFNRNPWAGGHMFRRGLMERDWPEEPRCIVAYDFEVDLQGVDPQTLQIALERPWLYEVTLNGKPVPEDSFEQWFDREFGLAPVAQQVQDGPNRLVLKAKNMNALVEIMPAYLRGEFSVDPTDPGFKATAPRPLPETGDLTAAGLPFYRGWVNYRYKIHLTEDCEGLHIALPAFEAAAARVWLNDQAQSAQTVLHPPYVARFDHPVPAGDHDVTIQLAGSLRNMMGPHHVRGLNGIWSWQLAPWQQPAGQDYELDHFGIAAPPNPIISNPNRQPGG